jgi:hypothetical protein
VGDDRDDSDRAAILGRRSRLIALALSGIGAAAGCGDPRPCLEPPQVEQPLADPTPCLEPMWVEQPDEPTTEGQPVACLSVAPPTEPIPADPQEETADETAPDPPPPEPRPRPRTHPCLSPPRDIPPCLTPLEKA